MTTTTPTMSRATPMTTKGPPRGGRRVGEGVRGRGRGRGEQNPDPTDDDGNDDEAADQSDSDDDSDDEARRRDGPEAAAAVVAAQQARKSGGVTDEAASPTTAEHVVHERHLARRRPKPVNNEIQGISGSTRLEANGSAAGTDATRDGAVRRS